MLNLPTTFRRSLITNIVALLFLLGFAITALQYWSTRRVVRQLSGALTNSTLAQTEDGLNQFFAPVNASLELAVRWGHDYNLVNFPVEQVFSLYAPFLEQVGYISSALLADETGREIMVLQQEDGGWYVREIDPARRGQQRVLKYDRDGKRLSDRLEDIEYTPTSRPWFKGAIEQLRQAPEGSISGDIFWTEPYEFFTTKEPGITAGKAFVVGSKTWVVAFDVLLMDISAFTTAIEVSPNGKVIVFDDLGMVVGLPKDPLFESVLQRDIALLQAPEDIGLPVLNHALLAIEEQGLSELSTLLTADAFRFYSDGVAWWGQVTPFTLGNRDLIIAVILPEKDLLGGVLTERFTVFFMLIMVSLAAVFRARWLGSRYANPVEELATASDRISQLKLDEPVEVKSHVKEIHQLVRATERMRSSLQNLLKLERDLQVARQIQQATFPSTLPEIESLEIAAYSEPADETGGDSYDVIGLLGVPGNFTQIVDRGHADSVMLFLADATGHGVGPALSVTQARSMIRMGARLGASLHEIAEHLNEQLSQDLSGGRFVTMWLGRYDSASNELWTLSAGQGPLLLYRAATGMVEEVAVDTTPLGIMHPLPDVQRHSIRLEPGDVFVVLSDGIFEAIASDNSMYGRSEVERILREAATNSAEQILEAIKEGVASFMGGCPSRDDQTGIIIKRTR